MQKTNSKHLKSILGHSLVRTGSKNKNISDPIALKKTPFRDFSHEILTGASNILEDCSTQTSKTILELAQLENKGCMSPDSLSPNEGFNSTKSSYTLEGSVEEFECLPFTRKKQLVHYLENPPSKPLTETYLEKSRKKISLQKCVTDEIGHGNRSRFLQQTSPLQKLMEQNVKFKSQSYIEGQRNWVKHNQEKFKRRFVVKNVSEKNVIDKTKPVKYYCHLPEIPDCNSVPSRQRTRRSHSFMSPTISSENKNKGSAISSFNSLIPTTRRGRSTTPKKYGRDGHSQHRKMVPYIDGSDNNSDTSSKKMQDQFRLNLKSSEENVTSSMTLETASSNCTSVDYGLAMSIAKLRDNDWNMSLRGLVEIVEICRVANFEMIFPHMTSINQRLVELLRSPRSHVCRNACQAAGHLFDYVKDTRRPEFDELVDTLLAKTADSNKFIRHDANLALDCMVTHIPTGHAIRSLTTNGPSHKNALVRTATIRLLVCAVVIAGTENILHSTAGEHTRKRIFLNLVKFLGDKSAETRKFGFRLYKQLQKDASFEVCMKKYLAPEDIAKIKKNVRSCSTSNR